MTTRLTPAWSFHRALLLLLALCLAAPLARAQGVVVLPLQNDARGRLRQQLEEALRKAPDLKVVPRARFEQEAAAAGFRGARARSPQAVAAVSSSLGISVAVSGTVGRRFAVQLLDAEGRPLSSRQLPLRRRLLAPRDVRRLVRAVQAAVASAPAPTPPPEEAPAAASPPAEAPPAARPPEEAPQEAPAEASPPGSPPSPAFAPGPEAPPVAGADAAAPAPERLGPPLVRLQLSAVTTWRSYCAAPGVEECDAFQRLPLEERPEGRSVDFDSPIPYSGLQAQLELFPLAALDSPLLQGLGVVATASRSWTQLVITESSPQGSGNPLVSRATDDLLGVMGSWRYHFPLSGASGVLPGHVGLRGGFLLRHFGVGQEAKGALPDSNRRFGAVGLEASVPVAKLVRVEASGLYFLSPSPGEDERRRFGSEVVSHGFGVELGVAGDVWGPLGYSLRFRLHSFTDRYTGASEEWFDGGGSADELSSSLVGGVTVSF